MDITLEITMETSEPQTKAFDGYKIVMMAVKDIGSSVHKLFQRTYFIDSSTVESFRSVAPEELSDATLICLALFDKESIIKSQAEVVIAAQKVGLGFTGIGNIKTNMGEVNISSLPDLKKQIDALSVEKDLNQNTVNAKKQTKLPRL